MFYKRQRSRQMRVATGQKLGSSALQKKAEAERLRHAKTQLTSGEALLGMKIWTTDAPAVREIADLCFALCIVLPGSEGQRLRVKQLEPEGRGTAAEPFEIDIKDAFNANYGLNVGVIPDLGLLPHKNCAAVLAFLRERYQQGFIYTTADPLLIAVNPFKPLDNTGDKWMNRYHESSTPESLEPHVFRVARTAVDKLSVTNSSQMIIVSGESGAGKTEATKQIMAFFAHCGGTSGEADRGIQEAVMAANPVLEAFGNAKTVRNNNSSRFGRFMQLHLAKRGRILHGSVKVFLLEKVRVTFQARNERSFHVFYQLLKGANAHTRASLNLLRLEEYQYINGGDCYNCPNVDDAADYELVNQTLKRMGVRADELATVWSLLAGILLLGNVSLEAKEVAGVTNAAVMTSEGKAAFLQCCNLFFINPTQLEKEMLFKEKTIGNQTIKSPTSLPDALVNRDSLAKAVYEKLFDWIVRRLNETIEAPRSFSTFMGMLDIFGFEVFEHNSLEQLLINTTNECLQKSFIQIVFARETELYREEGLYNAKIDWTDNTAIVEALSGKTNSVLAFLEDKSVAPGGTDESLVTTLNKCLASSTAWKRGRKDPRITFIICHSIADIEYDAKGFIAKNKDLLKPEMCALFQDSTNEVVRTMFRGAVAEKGRLARGQLIASQFMRSLSSLLQLISGTESHFIRCLKPNETKLPHDWNNAKVLAQLFSLSILESLQLKNFTYSYRRPYDEFIKQFEQLDLPVTMGAGDGREKSKLLLEGAGVPKEQCALGRSMIFLKPATVRTLQQMMRQKMVAWEPLVFVLEALYKFRERQREIAAEIPWLIRVQAHVRKSREALKRTGKG